MGKFWEFKNIEGNNEEVELRIDGEIVENDDAWIYEWFEVEHMAPNEFREALAEHKGKNITVWIDSWGGDIFAAAGIYNALKEHEGKVIIKVDGKAVSAGSIIAMAGEEVLMSPVSIMMIHNPISSVLWAEAKDMRRVAGVLDEVKETIINAYQLKTSADREKISKLMDEETWMSANKAVAEGFADGILYADNNDSTLPPVQDAFMFSRLAIQNSVSQSMERFYERYKQIKPPPQGEPSQDNLPPEPQAQDGQEPKEPEPKEPNNEPKDKQTDTGLLSSYQRLNQANINRRYKK